MDQEWIEDIEALIARLQEKGAVGLDMSPGDADCAQAAIELESLLQIVRYII